MRSFHLFRWKGIDVWLHSSWFLIALIELAYRGNAYAWAGWNVLEYLALFAIVLLHEFGHALACRSVGGQADRIVLWPLGGVAFVDPPQRPGATLWSLAAGPLVNVALAPLLWLAAWALPATASPDLVHFAFILEYINLGLLIFNMLPIYPLDGGQILRSLLWYPLGKARSLAIATGLGFVGVAGLFGLAWWWSDIWLAAIAAFAIWNCWTGWKHARRLLQIERAPRHAGLRCPQCHVSPPVGESWHCSRCQHRFDGFVSAGSCPGCQASFARVRCINCGEVTQVADWTPATVTLA